VAVSSERGTNSRKLLPILGFKGAIGGKAARRWRIAQLQNALRRWGQAVGEAVQAAVIKKDALVGSTPAAEGGDVGHGSGW